MAKIIIKNSEISSSAGINIPGNLSIAGDTVIGDLFTDSLIINAHTTFNEDISAEEIIISSSFKGDGSQLHNLTASNISNFTNDVRSKFSAGTNITISNGVVSSTGGGGTPGGPDTAIQFNSGNTFSGSINLVYNHNTSALSGTTARFTTITGSLAGNASTVTNGVYTTTISSHATTAVTAGSGLTGGGTVGSLTVNVGAGDGITVNTDDIAVNSTVIRTTGNQTLGGAKTFSSYITGSITGSDAKFTTITGSTATFTNVGIGTNSPSTKLHVSGGSGLTVETVNNQWAVLGSDVAGANYMTLRRPGTTAALGYIGGGGGGAISAGTSSDLAIRSEGSLYLATNGNVPQVVLNTLGNVGIGTTNPSSPLHVNGRAIALNFSDTAGAYNVNLGNGGTEGRGLVAGYSGGSYSGIGYNVRHTTTGGTYILPLADTSNYLLFSQGFQFMGAATGTAGRTSTLTELMRITNAGNVGIGTSSPSAKLEIKGTGTGVVQIGSWNTAAGSYGSMYLNGDYGTENNYNLLSSPGDKTLYINRPASANIQFRLANADQVIIAAGGYTEFSTAVVYAPGSSVNVTADGQAVTVGNRSYIQFTSNDIPANRSITLSNGLRVGQILILQVMDQVSINGIELIDSFATGPKLNGNWQGLEFDTLSLIWDGVQWIETSRSNN